MFHSDVRLQQLWRCLNRSEPEPCVEGRGLGMRPCTAETPPFRTEWQTNTIESITFPNFLGDGGEIRWRCCREHHSCSSFWWTEISRQNYSFKLSKLYLGWQNHSSWFFGPTGKYFQKRVTPFKLVEKVLNKWLRSIWTLLGTTFLIL